jgi:hypothetical protein
VRHESEESSVDHDTKRTDYSVFPAISCRI